MHSTSGGKKEKIKEEPWKKQNRKKKKKKKGEEVGTTSMCTVHMGILVNLGEWFSSPRFSSILGKKLSGGLRKKTLGPYHTFSLPPSQSNTLQKVSPPFFSIFPKIHSTKHILKVSTKESWKNKNSKREISQQLEKNNREMWRWGWNKEEERRRDVQVTHNIKATCYEG